MEKTCLILGGCGFIGSYVTEALLNHGYRIKILDRKDVITKNIARVLGDVELLQGDYVNRSVIDRALEGVDYIIHLICTTLPQTSCDDPIYDIETNLVPTVNLLKTAAKKSRIRKIIFSSSGGTIYGVPEKVPISENNPTFPICPYGITKLAIEKYLNYFYLTQGLNYTCLRISNPYGGRQDVHGKQGAVSVFLGRIWEDREIEIWGDGNICRDFIYVRDVADAFLKTLKYEGPYKIFNVGSGKPTSLNQLIQLSEEISGRKAKVKYVKSRDVDVPANALDISRIRDEVKWKPVTTLTEGIKITWEFIMNGSRSK